MPTDVQIASNALVLIGDEPISAFTEPGAGATAANALYEPTKKALLAEHPWTFALKSEQLAQLSEEPNDLKYFQYKMQIPTDMIRIWSIAPYGTRYEIEGDVLFSNNNDLLMQYVYDVEATTFPAHFVKAMEYKLASEFAQLVTESQTKSEYFFQLAKEQLGKAKAIDSQNRPQVPIVDQPFTDIRFGGAYGGPWGGGNY